MKVAKKANLGVLTLVFTLVGALSLVFAPAFVTPVKAQSTRTGPYMGNGTTTQVASGLTQILSLRIVTVPPHGQASEAYATNVIQAFFGSGSFLNGNRKDNGAAIERGNFTVTHPDFNEPGIFYFWEANDD